MDNDVDNTAPSLTFVRTETEHRLWQDRLLLQKKGSFPHPFRVEGTLDFSLVGILAGISDVLAKGGIGIFAVSTFNTDYVFTKADRFEEALRLLSASGYGIKY